MAERVDPSLYGLSISLALSTEEAFASLGQFEDKLVGIEEKLGDIAKQSIKHIQETIVDFDKVTKQLTKHYDLGHDMLKDLQKTHDHQDDIFKIYGDSTKILSKHTEFVKNFQAGMEAIIKTTALKNAKHAEQIALLRQDNELLGSMNSSFRDTNEQATSLAKIWSVIDSAIRKVWASLKATDAEVENFITSNYRAYGSQQELLQSTRLLTIEGEVFHKSALEAVKVLGDLRTPRDELLKYAKAIAEANRYLGVSIQDLGTFTRRMRLAGLDAAAAEKQLRFMSEAMRKFGLSTSDVSKILADTSVDVEHLIAMFGGIPEDAEKFDQLKAAMAGVALSAGRSAETGTKFINFLVNDTIALSQFEALAQMTIKSIDDLSTAQVRAGIVMENYASQREAEVRAGRLSAVNYDKDLRALAKVFYNNDLGALYLSRRIGQLAKQMKLEGRSAEELTKIAERLKDEALDPLGDSTRTFSAQWKLLTDKLGDAWDYIKQGITDALIPLLITLNKLAQYIGVAFRYISKFVAWIERIPVLGPIFKMLKGQAALVLVLGAAFLFVAGTIMILLGKFAIFGAGLRAIGGTIGSGLRELADAIRGSLRELLVLAVVMIAVAAAGYLLAMAAVMIAEKGWMAIGALIALGIILAVIIAVVVLVAATAEVSIPVLAILAGIIILVGLAALAMGYAVKLAAQGIEKIADVLKKGGSELTWNFIKLSFALIGLGIAAMIAGIPMIFFGIGLLIAAAAARVFAEALVRIVDALNKLPGGNILKTALQFLGAALVFAAAGVVFVVAGILLIAGAVALGIGAATIIGVSVALLFASGALLSSTAVFGVAVTAFLIVVSVFWLASKVLQAATLSTVRSLGLILTMFNKFAVGRAIFESISYGIMRLVMMIKELSQTTLGRWAASAIGAISGVYSALRSLGKTFLGWLGIELPESVPAQEPTERLTTALQDLQTALTGVDEAKITEDIAKLAESLNKSADVLEAASGRIDAAIRTKVVPALRSVKDVQGEVQAETISTVKVMDEREGQTDFEDDMLDHSATTVELLEQLVDKVTALQPGGKGEVSDILALLQQYMPDLIQKESGLSSELSVWGR